LIRRSGGIGAHQQLNELMGEIAFINDFEHGFKTHLVPAKGSTGDAL